MDEIKPKYFTEEEIVELLTTVTDEELEKCHKLELVPSKDVILFQGTPGEATVKDTKGNEYIDFTSQAWTLGIGYIQPDVMFAAMEQMKHLSHARNQFQTIPRIKLVNKLSEIAPGDLKKVVLNTQGGSVAVEVALKIAMVNRSLEQDIFITMWGGYHGNTLAMMAPTHFMPLVVRYRGFGREHFVKTPFPYCYRCPFGQKDISECGNLCLTMLQKTIDYGCQGLPLGVIIEPIQGPHGEVPAPPEFIKGAREICDKNNLLLIFDESQTAFGRIGTMFAAEYYDTIPDIMALTKALGGGFPMGATLASEKLEMFTPAEQHSTFSANPVCYAAALVNLELIQRLDLPKRAVEMGDYLKKRLLELQEKYPIMGDVRGVGLFQGVELVKDPETKEPANTAAEEFVQEALKKGLILDLCEPLITLHGEFIRSTLTIKPPLVITHEQIDRAMEIFEECLQTVTPLAKT
ncbi:MAG: aspartate aminotransferase family protein [Candidatus Freyarchaeota archaeon]|nr:aspartate aminotransferase family protein [Candidatus Freyarchaeota archaeon]